MQIKKQANVVDRAVTAQPVAIRKLLVHPTTVVNNVRTT